MKKSILFIFAFSLFQFSLLAQNRPPQSQFKGEEVFKNDDVVFHKIDDHTWVGNGHLSANESIYLIEGNDKAVLLDAGTKITDLDKIVASITSKPVTLMLTHVHPDHVGAANYFPEVYMNPGDKESAKQMMPNYKGEFKYLKDGQIIDLGGRQLEVVFTPAHTMGSTSYIDKDAGYGFSGDSFGSGNLLLFAGTFSDLIATCEKMSAIMKKDGIRFLYPGHYFGGNPETQQRIDDMITLSKDVLSGKEKGEDTEGNRFGFNHIITKYGVRINYGDKALK